jgi:hypothetical protein
MGSSKTTKNILYLVFVVCRKKHQNAKTKTKTTPQKKTGEKNGVGVSVFLGAPLSKFTHVCAAYCALLRVARRCVSCALCALCWPLQGVQCVLRVAHAYCHLPRALRSMRMLCCVLHMLRMRAAYDAAHACCPSLPCLLPSDSS